MPGDSLTFVSFSSEGRIDHQSVAEVAPNWAWYKYKTLEVCGNGEYNKCCGVALAWEMMARQGSGENVSAPFLRVLIICECTDPIPHTHSPSKRRAIHGRLLAVRPGGPLSLRRPFTTLGREIGCVCNDE